MTLAYRLNPADAAPVGRFDLTKWVPIADAAAALQLDPGHLARKCRAEYAAIGLAMLVTPPEGGQAKWFVRRSVDPALRTPEEQARHIVPDLGRYTLKQQDEARQRAACVDRLRHARATGTRGSTAAIVAWVIDQARRDFPNLRISRSRLYEWDQRYAHPCDLDKLIDFRGGDRSSRSSAEAWAAFKDLFLHQNQPSIAQCWELVKRAADEHGWGWCSYPACVKQLNKRIPPAEQAKHRRPKAYRDSLAPFIAQDPEMWRAGEVWIGDHKQLDLVCRWGESGLIRPWLTAWMDWRTRRVVGWVLSDSPNQTTILAALRHGLKDPANFGGPSTVWIDNGKDYDAWLFHGQTKQQRRERIRPNVDEAGAGGIFHALKIDAHFATPYNPRGKARIERWFRTLERFAKMFDTYTGDSVDTKPERLNDVLKTPRLVPTFELVRQRVADFIASDNASADHAIDDLIDPQTAERLSADQAMARWCDTRRVLADPKALDLLLMHWHRPVKANKHGITLTLAGRAVHYGMFEPALMPFRALRKEDRPDLNVSYDPHDLSTVRVYDAKWSYLCTAGMNVTGGLGGERIDVKHVAELNRQKAAHERAMKHVAENPITRLLSTEEQLRHTAASEREAARKAAEPATALQIVQTPLDGQARQIELDQLRPAAGSESAPLPAAAAPARRGIASLDRLRERVQPRRRDDEGDGTPSRNDVLAKLREQNHEW